MWCQKLMPVELIGVLFETADLLRFSVYRERSRKEKISSEQRMKMPWWCQRSNFFDRKATVTQMATCYIKAVQKNISEYTEHQILKQMSFSSRRPHRVPLLSPKNKKPRLEFTQKQQNWKIQDWKNIVWFDKSWFLLQHSDGSIRIWRQSGM